MGTISKIFFTLLVYLFIEIYVFVEVSLKIGFFSAALALLGFSIIGYMITKRIKSNTFKNALTDYTSGDSPSNNLLKTTSFFIAGIFFLMPGFVTDIIAVLFLIPYLNLFLIYLIFKYIKNKFKDSFTYYNNKNEENNYYL